MPLFLLNVKMKSIFFESVSFQSHVNGRVLLNDITSSFAAGSFSVVTGHSGSGKSMLLRCINGLVPRRFPGLLSGSITLESTSIFHYSESQLWKIVGSVFQEPERQFVSLNPREEISFSLLNEGLCCIEVNKKVTEIAEILQISHLLNRDLDTLSGGEKQKVAIASILVSDPEILLLDEPIASLDNKASRSIVALLQGLNKQNKTIVCAEHRTKPFKDAGVETFLQLSNGRLLNSMLTTLSSTHDLSTISSNLSHCSLKQDALITFRSVYYSICGDLILENINLSIYPGDIVALIGRNGAGKSTLLKHFIGLVRPSSGSIVLDDDDITKMTVAQLSQFVGYICQSPSSMIFSETVRNEIRFGLTNRYKEADLVGERLNNVASQFSLNEYLDTNPMLLSVGQKKLVCAAAITALEPRCIFVLDEPTASLDQISSEKLFSTITKNLDNRAIIFSSHNIEEVRRYSNRSIILDRGRIVEDLSTCHDLSDGVLQKYDLL
jgi:energy-coupling factor transporter ATP-binding protein EcfA2